MTHATCGSANPMDVFKFQDGWHTVFNDSENTVLSTGNQRIQMDASNGKNSEIETSHYVDSDKAVSECNKEVIYEMLKVNDSELNAQLRLEEQQQPIVQPKRQ